MASISSPAFSIVAASSEGSVLPDSSCEAANPRTLPQPRQRTRVGQLHSPIPPIYDHKPRFGRMTKARSRRMRPWNFICGAWEGRSLFTPERVTHACGHLHTNLSLTPHGKSLWVYERTKRQASLAGGGLWGEDEREQEAGLSCHVSK